VGKILRLRQKIMSVKDSVTGFFSGSSEKDASSEKLDAFKDYMAEARNVFRNPSTTEFVIVTIPTAMAAAESIRLAKALQKEQVPIRTLVVNQLLPPGLQDKYLQTRRADQQRALERLRADPELGQLQLIEAPLFDLEVRGVPALTYFGQQVWR
jgi:arsenite-transporting ATPase